MRETWTRSTKMLLEDLVLKFNEGTKQLDEFINQRLRGRHDFIEHQKIYLRFDTYDSSVIFYQKYDWGEGEEWNDQSYLQYDWADHLRFWDMEEEKYEQEQKAKSSKG